MPLSLRQAFKLIGMALRASRKPWSIRLPVSLPSTPMILVTRFGAILMRFAPGMLSSRSPRELLNVLEVKHQYMLF